MILLKLICGKRGQGRLGKPGEGFEFKEVHYYGDERDYHKPHTEHREGERISVWTIPALIDKVLRFQYEALEILFCHPSNLTHFDPVLIPLFASRKYLVCQPLVDKLSDRAMSLLDKGLKDSKGRSPYNVSLLEEGGNLMCMAYSLMDGNGFYPQCESDLRDSFNFRDNRRTPTKVKSIFVNHLQSLRNNQIQSVRSKTERERFRGDGPESILPPALPKDLKKAFCGLEETIFSKLKSRRKVPVLKSSELEVLYGNQARDYLGCSYGPPSRKKKARRDSSFPSIANIVEAAAPMEAYTVGSSSYE